MYAQQEVITPDKARIWLDTKNFGNRPISESTVRRYAQEMKAGRWKLNGEAIIFGVNGRLLNGQHRLKGCIAANTPFSSLVVQGVADDAFDTLDDGKRRTLADVLSIQGVPNALSTAAALRFIYEYGSGIYLSRGASRKIITTKQLLEEMLERHPGLKQSAKLYQLLLSRPGGLMLTPAVGIGLHYIFSLIDSEKADTFFTSFQSGLNLAEGNPILMLRARLITQARDNSAVVRNEALYSYTVQAWNAYARGAKLTRLQYKFDAPLVEIDGVPPSLMKELL